MIVLFQIDPLNVKEDNDQVSQVADAFRALDVETVLFPLETNQVFNHRGLNIFQLTMVTKELKYFHFRIDNC